MTKSKIKIMTRIVSLLTKEGGGGGFCGGFETLSKYRHIMKWFRKWNHA